MSQIKFTPVIPVIKAEEEASDVADPQKELKEKCSLIAKAQKMNEKFQECTNRVKSRESTAETCEEELIDYLHVLDKCVNDTLFSKLK